MFFRGSYESKGSGLGLYIVKNAVEKLKGTIDLKSQLGIETEFIVKLPKLTI
jgi:signal transduction histidine kinase